MNVATPRYAPRVYFFQRTNGEIIAVDGDREAWNLYAHPTKVYVNELPPRHIGTSNGKAYLEAIRNAPAMAQAQGMEAAQKMVRDAFNAEVEIARKTVIPPPDLDRVDRFGNPTQLR